MSLLSRLAITDLRSTLPRKAWEIGRRRGKATSITLHYNGEKPVPATRQRGEGVLQQLRIDTAWQMRDGWSNTLHGADGLQYHLIVDADGRVYQTRDLDSQLWHCRNAKGNAESIAVHLLVGGPQPPTREMWASFTRLCDALITDEGMASRRVVRGHQEWASTDCPGKELMHRLTLWRVQPLDGPKPGRYKVLHPTAAFTARDGKTVAWGGKAELPIDLELDIDDITDGWAHWPPAGFVPLDDLEAV